MKTISFKLMVVGVMAALLSCSSDEPAVKSNDYVAPKLTEAQSRMIDVQRGVGFTMWDAVRGNGEEDNLVLSPMSVSMALSMLANGADGETREVLLNGLGMQGENIDALNEINSKILKEFPKLDNRVKFAVANSAWNDPSRYTLLTSFTDRMKSLYGLERYPLGKDGEKNKNDINEWISKNTEGMIKDFFQQSIPFPFMLVNTVYFKAPWADTDVKECVVNFTSRSGFSSVVPGFKLSGRAQVDGDLIIATAEYGNGAYNLTIVMPESGALPSGKEIAAKWMDWKSGDSRVALTLPEWDVETKYPLDGAMKKMGLGKIFEDDASFANMTTNPGGAANMQHGVHIITNSKGTEAAAVTTVGFTWPGPPKEVIVDHPFVYIISEKTTDAILFIGEVTKFQ